MKASLELQNFYHLFLCIFKHDLDKWQLWSFTKMVQEIFTQLFFIFILLFCMSIFTVMLYPLGEVHIVCAADMNYLPIKMQICKNCK